MKKMLAVIMTVLLMASVFVPVFSVTAEAAVSIQIDNGGYINAQLSTESMLLEDEIEDYYELKSYITEKLINCETTIDVSQFKIPSTDLTWVRSCLYYDCVEAFHVESFSYYKNTSTGLVTRLVITYNMTKAKYTEEYNQCEEIANSFIADLKDNTALTDVEKALLVHDRLAQWCEYDYQSFLDDNVPDCSYNMNGAFCKGIAVCAGYSRAYKFMLEKLGIRCYLCASDTLCHEWNIVEIGGKRYHVDVTWDDPTWDVFGRVKHTNFLRSTNGIISTGHTASDFETSPVSTTYDSYFWQDSETEFQYKNGIFYYYDTTNKQLKKIDNGVTSTLLTVNDKWKASSTSYYAKSFVRLDSDNSGNYLFYSTTTSVYKYDLDTNTSTVVYTPELPGSYYWIYGFKAQDNYFYLNIYNNANLNNEAYENNIIYRYQEDPLPTHTVTYNYAANGGTSASAESAVVEEGKSVDLTVTAVKNGWNFLGWSTQSNSTSTVSSLNMGESDITLYAVFSKDITGTFVSSSTTGWGRDVTLTVYNNSVSVNMPFQTIQEKTGWTSIGWTTSVSPQSQPLTGSYQTISENTTYYAIYGKTVTVSYDSDGGSEVDSQAEIALYNAYGNYYYPDFTVASAPQKTGYSFTGWSDENGTVYNPGALINPTDDISLKAGWSADECTVFFDENYDGGTVTNKTVVFDSAYGELPAPERTGYTFDGWFTSSQGGVITEADTVVDFTGNKTLYAHWTAKNDTPYTVKHYIMNSDGTYPEYEVLEENLSGTTDSVLVIENLAKASFIIDGCITYGYGTADGITVSQTTVSPDGTREICIYYARSRYTLELTGGTGIESVSGAETYYYGQTVTINAVVSDGYKWTAWNKGTDILSEDKEYSFVMPAENLSLAAKAEVSAKFGVKEGSTTVIDNGRIYGLKTELTLNELKNNFLDIEGVEVTYTKKVRSSTYYGTGSTIKVEYPDGTVEEYVIIIFGDVDGNGRINSTDGSKVSSAVFDNTLLDENQQFAANVDGKRRIAATDATAIYKASEGSGLNQVNPRLPVE